MRLYTIPGITRVADVYGSGTYGDCTYDKAGSCSTTGGGTTSGGTLDNTGIMVGMIVGIAALLLLVVLLVRFWRRPAKLAEEPAEIADDDPGDESAPRAQ